MYEDYSHQSVPSKKYRELIGTAVCVFNSNNGFIIENILRIDNDKTYDWFELIDRTSGRLLNPIKETITKASNDSIANLFEELVEIRNRIIHSFRITATEAMSLDNDDQILATKHKNSGTQEIITEEYIMNFIRKNDELSSMLHSFRGY
ncbi:selenium binding protein [Pantoea agglomerans]|uniref:selenium binding protein n=1 Tax=Enterobacter agglomerans TaxID=549 RepID=UPI00216692AA|nr:selenium binding protein [Pantoea agglomerans]MDN4624703.1 selenium binding protein [Pantoea agglomerans]UVV73640.1 selenium binding protein [Pantoea agglomerans]